MCRSSVCSAKDPYGMSKRDVYPCRPSASSAAGFGIPLVRVGGQGISGGLKAEGRAAMEAAFCSRLHCL